jgi:hypothetical protein
MTFNGHKMKGMIQKVLGNIPYSFRRGSNPAGEISQNITEQPLSAFLDRDK